MKMAKSCIVTLLFRHFSPGRASRWSAGSAYPSAFRGWEYRSQQNFPEWTDLHWTGIGTGSTTILSWKTVLVAVGKLSAAHRADL